MFGASNDVPNRNLFFKRAINTIDKGGQVLPDNIKGASNDAPRYYNCGFIPIILLISIFPDTYRFPIEKRKF